MRQPFSSYNPRHFSIIIYQVQSIYILRGGGGGGESAGASDAYLMLVLQCFKHEDPPFFSPFFLLTPLTSSRLVQLPHPLLLRPLLRRGQLLGGGPRVVSGNVHLRLRDSKRQSANGVGVFDGALFHVR